MGRVWLTECLARLVLRFTQGAIEAGAAAAQVLNASGELNRRALAMWIASWPGSRPPHRQEHPAQPRIEAPDPARDLGRLAASFEREVGDVVTAVAAPVRFECNELPFSSAPSSRDAAILAALVMGTRTLERGDRRRRCTRGRSRAVVGMAANPSGAHQAGRHRAGQEGWSVPSRLPLLGTPIRYSPAKQVTAPAALPRPPTASPPPGRTSRLRCSAPSPAPCCSTRPRRRVR